MKPRKSQVSLALRLWILASVFTVPFLDPAWIAAWAALGGGLALWWRALPEEPEAPPPRLPYQDEYERRRGIR